jgi:predicted nucleotidyltransferase
MPGLSAAEDTALKELATRLRRRLGQRIVEVRLYGSKARGASGVRSDVDVAVVVDRQTAALRRNLYEEVSAVILEHEVLLDVHVLDQGHLERLRALGSAYADRLQREGVTV